MNRFRNKILQPSLKEWCRRFKQLAKSDSKVINVLSRGVFYGDAGEMLPFLLYMYVLGAPSGPQIREHLKPGGGDLASQMEDLANAIKEYDKGRAGPVFRRFLTEASGQLPVWPPSRRLAEEYARLPQLLSGLALILKFVSLQNRHFSPPNRKHIKSRALVLLYLHFSVSPSAIRLRNRLGRGNPARAGDHRDAYEKLYREEKHQ